VVQAKQLLMAKAQEAGPGHRRVQELRSGKGGGQTAAAAVSTGDMRVA